MPSPLLHGTPGHPLHPPLTDVVIGMFVLAAATSVIGAIGWIEAEASHAMLIALVGGIAAALLAAGTGLADYLTLERGSRARRIGTRHMLVNLGATALFAVAAVIQATGWDDDQVTAGGLVLTLAGLVVLSVGGWLGGKLVFQEGLRVEAAAQDVPPSARRAA